MTAERLPDTIAPTHDPARPASPTLFTRQNLLAAAAALVVLGGLSALILSGALVASDTDKLAATAEPPHTLRGIHYNPPRLAPALHGIDHNARAFSLKRQPHPLAMVFFGYVSCLDVCPTNLKKFEKIEENLGEDADQVQFLFVTIDPEKETPEELRAYLGHYHGEIVGLTARPGEDMQPTYDNWGVVRRRVELEKPIAGRDYAWDHSGQIYLVMDGQRIAVSYPYGTSVEAMTEDVRALLKDPTLGQRLPEVGEVRDVSIEAGSYTRAAQQNPTLPSYLRVNVGDAIRWKNDDYMYHFVGDIALAPGQSALQKFDEPGDFYFGCTAVPQEVIRIRVFE
ncbi:hypothetical protein DV096_04990 [Bradymonadaceae bacterium TMQ3]|nr:hypothetical protein DV096_04990 [Bradymonadaceae bacterium TMQ3]TXC77332.1 hypothetical protein FRC91_00950 [Bradymonadales bacterium TMQ1]